MKLILFSASVFYLLGLKLTTQIQVKPHPIDTPAVIESKLHQEIKNSAQPPVTKPKIAPCDSATFVQKAGVPALKTNSKPARLSNPGKGPA